jgi:hypothetical protein
MRARFCCADKVIPGQEITVQDANGVSLFPFTRDAGNYGPVDTLYAGGPLSLPANDVATPIFVLVSHGDGGGGAFLPNGTRAAGSALTGLAETENMNGDNVFVWALRNNVAGNLHYDDTVLWRTQEQVYAETGSGTCALP